MEISIKWNVCRICLVKETDKSKEHYRSISQIKDFSIDVYKLAGVVIKDEDGLPDKVCLRCVKAIKFALGLRARCLQSDQYLKTVLQTTQTASQIFCSKADDVGENCEIDSDNFDQLISQSDKDGEKESGIFTDTTIADGGVTKDFHSYTKEKHTIKKEKKSVTSKSDYTGTVADSKEDTNLQNDDLANAEDVLEEFIGDGDGDGDIAEALPLTNDEEMAARTIQSFQNESNCNEDAILAEANIDEDAHGEESEAIHIATDEDSIYVVLDEASIKKEHLKNYDPIEENISTSNDLKILETNEYVNEEEMPESVEIVDVYEDASNSVSEIEYLSDDLEEQFNENLNVKEFLELDTNSNISEASRDDSTNLELFEENSSNREVKPKKHVFSSSKVVCDKCGNHFSCRSHLNYHMRIHLQPKKYECELCHKRFNAACNLSQHMRTHTGERPYECEFCHRRFTDRSTHVKHVRIHTNEKPFNCSYCGKSFSLSTTLKAHEKIHTGEKPFKCDPCGKSFKLPHHLKAHQKTFQHKFVVYPE